MIRKVIQIDESKCNGCGLCVGICAEAALEIVDGKAKVVGDSFCDGLGACLNVCPTGALTVVEKDAADYDPRAAYDRVKNLRGEEAAKMVHGAAEIKSAHGSPAMKCGCPGSMTMDFTTDSSPAAGVTNAIETKSQLRQWPIQLHLLSPQAPYLHGADLVIAADCAPFAYPNFHQKFLAGKILTILCPKLDSEQDQYVEKLADIFTGQNIKSVTVVHMEVPCCGGIEQLVRQAMAKSGQNILLKDYTISIRGEII